MGPSEKVLGFFVKFGVGEGQTAFEGWMTKHKHHACQ